MQPQNVSPDVAVKMLQRLAREVAEKANREEQGTVIDVDSFIAGFGTSLTFFYENPAVVDLLGRSLKRDDQALWLDGSALMRSLWLEIIKDALAVGYL